MTEEKVVENTRSKKEIEDAILRNLSPEQISAVRSQLQKELDNAVENERAVDAVRPQCKMRVCEDPSTGQVKLVYQEGCPKGYIERIASSIATRGVSFGSEKDEAVKEDDKD